MGSIRASAIGIVYDSCKLSPDDAIGPVSGISIILNDFETIIDSPAEICRRRGNLCKIIREGYESRLTA